MSIQIAVCMAALTLSPADEVTVDQVDLIEVNHFYDDQGRLVFDQVIYYDWSEERSRYQVRDWRLLKTPTQIPLRDWRDGGYVSEWQDFKQRNGLRRVKAKAVRETWTQYDPELVEREFLAQEKRESLTRIQIASPYSQPRNSARSTTPRLPRSTTNEYQSSTTP
ncbi:MAG: hypothetical protein H6822_27170 [Planctomycetaceae bacterium]|nr:hypothetical protein [Planctomycetales bacterium]MCB9925860.1 hypothetical protein [Planctomycetaceae bacterium]